MPRLDLSLRAVPILALFVLAAIAHAQDPLVTLPNNYKLILDNPELSVIRVHYGPHEKVAVHDHSNFPTIYVYLDDSGEVRFTHDEQPPFVMVRPATQTGSFRVAPSRPERHSVENLSDKPSDYLRIELKKLPLDGLQKPFRGQLPDPLKPGDSEEFHNSGLTIHRIVCAPGPPCTYPAPSNTLLVILTPTILHTQDPGTAFHNNLERRLQDGETAWEENPTNLRIEAAAQKPAHILAISLANAPK